MDHSHHHQHVTQERPASHEHHHGHPLPPKSVQDQKTTAPSMSHHAHGTHDKHAGHHTTDFLRRFWVCLVLTLPVLLLSHMIQQWAGFQFRFGGDKYVLLALGSAIYLYGGWPFFTGMVAEIRDRAIGMMTLVALAITVAFIYSTAVVFGLQGMDFFWELATLVDIMLLGHWLEMRSQNAASRALESLVALLPSAVHIERNGSVVDGDMKDLTTGDIVLVKPGEKVPADGVVLEGLSNVNESMPVQKAKDAKVIGGSVNGDGALRVKVTGVGSNSYLNKVINLVQSAQAAKSNTQNLADRVAKWLTLIAITVGMITFIYWYSVEKNLAFALERMVTVMVTACPHALGVAIPLVVAISTALSATRGLLIRNRTAFENARNLTTIIFDKTGTLTKGSHEVQKVIPLKEQYSEADLLQYAASVQQNSEHHIAHGIITVLRKQNLPLWKVENFRYIQGIGVSGIVEGKEVLSVGPNYFAQNHLSVPPIPDAVDQDMETVSFLLINGESVGVITLADTVRETSAEAIAALRQMGVKSFLLTGDNQRIAGAVAKKLNMDGYLANVLPHEKQTKVKEFQDKGEITAMTGDGVNDAPALAQADVGIAVGSGTDVAAETADIVLVNSDPKDVVNMIAFGRATYRKMIQNLAWAVGYNVVAIPLAAGFLHPHFTLSPAMGAVLMSLSTVVVAINAQLLRSKINPN